MKQRQSMDTEIVKKRKIYKREIEVPTPSKDEVLKYLQSWDNLENYTLQENALNKLFLTTYPNNVDINDILIKVASLNDFYSTNILSPFKMAKHILELNIDSRLSTGDLSLVNDIATLEVRPGKIVQMYSFASKYCSHHYPDIYPIYDSYVEYILKYFKSKDAFSTFKNSDLKNFSEFKKVIIQFQEYYKIEEFSVKNIDRYLWQLGKHYFPRNYN